MDKQGQIFFLFPILGSGIFRYGVHTPGPYLSEGVGLTVVSRRRVVVVTRVSIYNEESPVSMG